MMRFYTVRKYILAFRKKAEKKKERSTVRIMFFDFSSANSHIYLFKNFQTRNYRHPLFHGSLTILQVDFSM